MVKTTAVIMGSCLILSAGLVNAHQFRTHALPDVTNASFDDGYAHGCKSAVWYDLDVVHKDFSRTVRDKAYSSGWDYGFTQCRYNIYRDS